jgi:asparagine N-glycosylation enzyme membrane subunit Stt3
MLVGGTLTLLLFGIYVFLATQTDSARPGAWAAAAGLATSVPVLAWPEDVLRLSAFAAAALFGAGP